jgi:hypothetical protein
MSPLQMVSIEFIGILGATAFGGVEIAECVYGAVEMKSDDTES